MTCPRCGGRAKFQRYRQKTVTTLLGKARYERACYHGCGCSQSWYPTDEQLGLADKITPGAAEVLTLQGSLAPFDEAAQKVLPKTSGLNVSPSTVRRVTEGVGLDLSLRRQQGETFGRSEAWDWHVDAQGQRCGYVSLDATGVRQQAADGSTAEGRMVWVGEVFNPTPAGQRKRGRFWEARYLSGLMPLREMGRQLLCEARAVGLDQAEVLIGLTDGGNGLEDCLLEEVFSKLGRQAVFILDFFHAAEHVCQFAQTLFSQEPSGGEQQAGAWCHTLKHEGGRVLLEELEGLDAGRWSESIAESHRQLCQYLRNNLHRTDYPRYQACGWHIGSGSIESACKNVINARLDGSGMRWAAHGAHELAHVRGLFKSEPSAWNDYWSRPPTTIAA